jgi:hypothetical protein
VDEVGRTYSTHESEDKCIQTLVENIEGRRQPEQSRRRRDDKLKWIKNYDG